MPKYTVIFNPLSNNSKGEDSARRLSAIMDGNDLEYVNITQISDYKTFFSDYPIDSNFILAGGDGTINRFVNDVTDSGASIPENLFYFPAGSGNDLFKDVGGDPNGFPIRLTPYLKDLPTVEVNGIKRKFVNGIGYGIDGYCCEEGDRLREVSNKPINYTSIAIKGLLYKFKPSDGTITVDGKSYRLKKIWLAPTMNGRYFGGGMMPTPGQDRLNPERKLTLMTFYSTGKLQTLMRFPKIFTGEHVNFKKNCLILEGYDFTVEYDHPCALQIDGETILTSASADAARQSLTLNIFFRNPSAVVT